MADLVQSQIIAAVRFGRIPLIQNCVVGALELKTSPLSSDLGIAKPPIRRPATDEDNDEPLWSVLPTYWNDPQIDWEESVIRVDCSEIICSNGKSEFLDRYIDPKIPVVIHLSVDDPDHALRKLADHGPLPDEEWFSKYNRLATIQTRECTAAAWRLIAMLSLKNEHGIQERLVLEMNNYAIYRGYKISDETLRGIARKIKKQWDLKDLSSEVFVNSSRRS